MNSKSKNVYIDKLDEIVKQKNKYRTIKMEPFYIKENKYINFDKEVNDTDPKCQFGDHVRISKYKNIFAKVK